MSLVYSRSFLDETERLESAIRSAGGGLTFRRKEHIDDVVLRLKTNYLWSRIDCLQIYAQETTQGALINWRTPGTFNASLTNAPTFAAGRGYTTNGTNNYVNTNFTASTAGGSATLDNTAVSLWSLTSGQQTASSAANDGTQFTLFNPRNTSDQVRGAVNGTAIITFASSHTDGSGFYTFSRTASNLVTAYKAGASIGTDATASVGLPTTSFLVGSNNGAFTAREFACFVIGASRTSTEEAALYAILRAYMTAVGVP
jgi:hypothetical protein